MKALTPWKPFSPLSLFRSEFDDLFSRFFGEEEKWMVRPFEDAFTPAIESFVRGEELVVRADLPGIEPKDVELSVEGDRLTIKGERKVTRERETKEQSYREVRYGRYERSLALPPGVDAESIKATYDKGVLEITMKAPKGLVSKKVPITIH